MGDVLVALGRSIRSLVRPGVFIHLVWPGVVSTLLWIIVAWLSWGALTDWIGNLIGVSGKGTVVVKMLVVLALLPLIFVFAMLLVSSVALPIMLDHVARRDYADLEQRRGGSNMGSVRNTLRALPKYLLVIVVSLPFWLIPGVALVVPLLATSWLNQRLFGYDALMLHADGDELVSLPQEVRSRMRLLGGVTALPAYIPVVNIVASALSGLAFVHFLLEALRRRRSANSP
ncbi:MAG: EI24 domain-containing protein [Azoarcus sp.]|jgi:uncharacterized protein involved in cysteine biosynthesis|nr:EI24 domain-containing protein [Azoarcus sp.]